MALEDVYRRNLEHRTHRAGWLRAAVLGANDGLVSTSSLMVGVAAANTGSSLVTVGLAGIAAGATADRPCTGRRPARHRRRPAERAAGEPGRQDRRGGRPGTG